MPKRWSRRRISHKSRTKRGLGQGRGPTFQPYLGIRDVHSEGKSTCIIGWTTGRLHVLFSTLEVAFFLLLDWLDDVVDIREQFPLPIDVTRQLARELHVRHPRGRKNRELSAFTTDFLYTRLRNGSYLHLPRAAKYSSDLSDVVTSRKLEVERLAWRRQPAEHYAPWKVVTEQDIPWQTVKNIAWVHEYRRVEQLYLPTQLVADLSQDMTDRLPDHDGTLADLCAWADARSGAEPGTGLLVARHLFANKLWTTDMRVPHLPGSTIRIDAHANLTGEVIAHGSSA